MEGSGEKASLALLSSSWKVTALSETVGSVVEDGPSVSQKVLLPFRASRAGAQSIRGWQPGGMLTEGLRLFANLHGKFLMRLYSRLELLYQSRSKSNVHKGA